MVVFWVGCVYRPSHTLSLSSFQTLLQIVVVDLLRSLAEVIGVLFALLLQSQDHLHSIYAFDIACVLQSPVDHISLVLGQLQHLALLRVSPHLILDQLTHLGEDVDKSPSQNSFGEHFRILTMPDAILIDRFLWNGRP